MRYKPPPWLRIKLGATGLECKAVSLAAAELGGGRKPQMPKKNSLLHANLQLPDWYRSLDLDVSTSISIQMPF